MVATALSATGRPDGNTLLPVAIFARSRAAAVAVRGCPGEAFVITSHVMLGTFGKGSAWPAALQ